MNNELFCRFFTVTKVWLVIVSISCFQGIINAQNCDFSENELISLTISGYNTDSSFIQSYALTEVNGIILEISDSPTFPSQNEGNYYAYAVNYDTTSSISNYSIGNNITSLEGSCLDTMRVLINVCPCSTDCHSFGDTISVQHTGYNMNAGFSQVYALTDSLGLILQTIASPLTTKPLFSDIAPGHYHIYAINYDTTSTLNGLIVGNSIKNISGDCIDISSSLCYNICNGNYDYGDLPDSSDTTALNDYQTLLSNNGPRHLIIPGLFLGDSVDVELDGIPSEQALGDGIDEDGIIIFSTMNLAPDITFRLPLAYTNTTGDTAHLEIWVDWNADGAFDKSNEMVKDWDDSDTPFPNQIELGIPKDAATGVFLGLRIRLSLQDEMTPYGLIHSGEVEDYLLFLDCPKIFSDYEIITNEK